jgi:lactoylglutathione lyase
MHIEHVAIWCKDLERMKEFYVTFFGARSNDKYWNESKEFESYFLSFDSGARLELMHAPSVPGRANDALTQFTGLVHLAFSVGSEGRVDELTRELKRDGYQVIDGPRWTGDGYYESVALDPEGNRVEIAA